MHHVEGDGTCLYCGEIWPCPVATMRRELAYYLRGLPVGSTGDPVYDNGREAGLASAADSIDI